MTNTSIWGDYYEKGKYIEILFGNTIDIFGDVIPASKTEDIFDHWDIKLIIHDIECPLIKTNRVENFLTFDVKSLKRTERSDEHVNENQHYVELKNVKGKPGWLYGKSDYIAFEKLDSWVIVDRLKLINFIHLYTQNPKYCFKPILYGIYTRNKRQDEVMLVETKKLEEISTLILKK